MSDHWEFFPCQMGEDVAFIFYDHGVRESIDSSQHNLQVRFDLTYKAPAENGMPTNEEFEAVKNVENQIDSYAETSGGMYVGRVTVAGHRYFYCYMSAGSEDIDGFVARMEDSTGYRLDVRSQDDPRKEGYWKDLYPTDDDWQMIQDSKVVEALKNHGDIHEIERRIDHWAFFGARSDAKSFVSWVESEGFTVHDMKRVKPLSGKWKVQFYRIDSPELYTINGITYKLRHKVIELNGEYDGWETSVEKDDR